jgi:hypothetical protein
MKRFVMTTVWTKQEIIEAEDLHYAYSNFDPDPEVSRAHGLALSNWHAIEIPDGHTANVLDDDDDEFSDVYEN